MKPILSVPSLVVAAALTLTGCGNTAAPEAGNSTITTSTEEQVASGSTERLSANTKKSAEADFGTNQCDVVLGEKIDGEGKGSRARDGEGPHQALRRANEASGLRL